MNQEFTIKDGPDGVSVMNHNDAAFINANLETISNGYGCGIMFKRKTMKGLPEPKTGLFHWMGLTGIESLIVKLENARDAIVKRQREEARMKATMKSIGPVIYCDGCKVDSHRNSMIWNGQKPGDRCPRCDADRLHEAKSLAEIP